MALFDVSSAAFGLMNLKKSSKSGRGIAVILAVVICMGMFRSIRHGVIICERDCAANSFVMNVSQPIQRPHAHTARLRTAHTSILMTVKRSADARHGDKKVSHRPDAP